MLSKNKYKFVINTKLIICILGNNVQVISHREKTNFLAQIYDITAKDIMLKTIPFNKQSIKYK